MIAACTGEIGGLAPPSGPRPGPATAREAKISPLRPPDSPVPTPTPRLIAAAPTLAIFPTATPVAPTPAPAVPTLAPAAALPPATAVPVNPTPLPPAVSFTIPLASISELESLSGKPEIEEILEAARRYPSSGIYLAAYAAEEDARARGTDVTAVSDSMVVTMGRALASRGIAAERIAGKGMGANANVGRAIVVSIDVAGASSRVEPSARELAEREAAAVTPERFPQLNRAFKEIAGTAAYRVGPGDQLKITSWLTSGAQVYDAIVGSGGTISFDLVREAPVEGLTLQEIESLLASILKRYIRAPRIAVSVATYASRNVTLIGPGGARSVALSGRTTILDLIARQQIQSPSAGGSGAAGLALPDLKRIRVVRGNREFSANVFQIVDAHDWKENFVLDEGDVIYLPTLAESRSYVLVLGAVVNPGMYPIPTRISAVEAVFAAGGPTTGAYLPHARVIRGDIQGPQILTAGIDRVIKGGDVSARMEIQGGDVVYVPTTRIANWNAFLADLRPTIELATLPFQGAFGAILFGGLGKSRTTNTTTVINPLPTPVPTLPVF